MKVLSVVVPMYNTELYIERCLDSLLYHASVVDDIEIIVVSDGSTDSSLEVANRYKKKYPGSIVVVDKENGGHGSAVNAGVKIAKGRYVRVVDSDDWVDIDNFEEYVKKLKTEKADIVVTDVRRQQLYDESELNFRFKETSVKPIPIEKVADKIMEDNFFFEFSMHSMTVKTEKLREVWDKGLLEKTFYVDQQFVAKVFMCAKNFVEYRMNIYMYFIGRPEQSMGDGFFKHIEDHERVLRWLLKTTENEQLPEYYKTIVARQVILMLRTHYLAYVEQPKLSKVKKNELIRFDAFLKKEYPGYYKKAGVSSKMKQVINPVYKTKAAKAIHYLRKGKV